MDFKMVCLDIDGTLLNSKHMISENTKKVIYRITEEKQIPIILVSARMPKGILFLQEELNIIQPIICYSGSLIQSNNTTLLNNTISLSDVKPIYGIMKELNIHVSLYRNNEWYVEEMDEWAQQESEITNIKPTIIKFADLFSIWTQKNSGPNKILCMSSSSNIKELNKKIQEYHFDKLNVYPSKPTYLEIMPISATKTSAIEFLCKRFNISKSQVIAIGDNYNDMDMIKFAGLGIAMGNAPDEVKKCADDITFSNDDDGVAKALEKYII